ncbi:glycosyltransferase [Pseudomonas asiatica]|jgi:glycosyltransferase involved in cell wall biosynthesis|uniref:glycosyltransferase n=1 Tax=Pseudomonas asiatica TaxID=2219225 RepID=UPI001F5097D5|nr:glycosyltransferase [Pseudomonas asiatica]
MQNSTKMICDSTIIKAIEELFSEGGAEYAYSVPISGWEVENISNFYGTHLAIWQLREEDLQKRYPLNSPEQRADFLAWCVVHGQLEYQALRELKPFWNELLKPALVNTTEWSGGISRLIQLAIRGRPDLKIDPELHTAQAQENALAWFYVQGGWKELGQIAQTLPSWKRSFFLGKSNLAQSPISKLIYKSRNDIQAAYDVKTEQGLHSYNQWLVNHATIETGLGVLITPIKQAWPTQCGSSSAIAFGVNLIGYAYGELGIGEDVRMAAHSLHAAGIPFTIINVNPGENIRQHDHSVKHWVSEEPKYLFNVVCLTALEHLRVYLERGSSIFSGRYNIGYWPWELHNWPKKWKHCFNLVDEVWASSKHIQRAATAASDITVRHMPMAVPSPPLNISKEAIREKYQLPLAESLFIFSFDGNSHIKRKNPIGILEAFNQAFSDKNEKVCLVIKCMRPDTQNKDWQSILAQSKTDKRIRIVDKTLSKQDVMELYQSCDCFVSLHRAEGFGRGIAEALSLGLEVIATNYGGNVDFCEALEAELISFQLTPMKSGDYVEADENLWAEPDLKNAASAMQAVHTKIQKESYKLRMEYRSDLLDKTFSPASIGSRYKNHLNNLYQLIK